MKKALSTFVIIVLIAGKSFAQQGAEKKGWSTADRHDFITECIKTASKSMSEDTARFYCSCMQENVEKKYPDISEAAKITAEDMQSEAWQKEIKSCLGGYWGTKDRSGFLTECIKSAKVNIGEEKAKKYCECMLFKVEVKYPNPADAGKLTAEDIASPAWKKMIGVCLAF